MRFLTFFSVPSSKMCAQDNWEASEEGVREDVQVQTQRRGKKTNFEFHIKTKILTRFFKDPLAVIDEYGTDLARLQLLFEARPSQPINWPYPYPTYREFWKFLDINYF